MRQKLAVAGFSYLCAMIFASVFVSAGITYGIAATVILPVILTAAARMERSAFCLAAVFAAAGVLMFITAYFPLLSQRSLADGNIYRIKAVVADSKSVGNDIAVYTLESNINKNTVRFIMFADDRDVRKGDVMTFDAKFDVIENSTAFSGGGYYLSQGITLSASLRSELELSEEAKNDLPDFLEELRDYFARRISSAYPDEGGALMRGIFLGDKSAMSYTAKYNVKAAGAAHLTAVSGMHLTLIIHILASVFTLFGLGKAVRARTLLITLSIGVFMIFFGLSASVLRSGIMLIIHYSGQLIFRKSDCVNSIGAALLIILTFDPLACLDAGLVFSALTTVGAGCAAPALSKVIKERFCLKRGAGLADTLCCCCCASLFSLPLSVIYFETLPVYGAVTSLLCIPFFTVSLIFILLFALTGGIFDILLIPANACCTVMDRMFTFFAELPYSHISCSGITEKFAVLAVVAVVITFYIFTDRNRAAICAYISAFGAVIVITSCVIRMLTFDGVRIKPFTDGEGGCLLIESRDYSCAAVFSGGEEVADLLYSAVRGDNIGRLDFLYIMNDDKNSEAKYTEMFGDIVDTIYFPEDSEYIENADMRFTLEPNRFLAEIKRNDLSISAVSDRQNTDLAFYYGSGKLDGELYGRSFYFDKDQVLLYGDDINVYYEETYLELSNDGGLIIKGGGEVNDYR